jgi:repressor LexA
MLKTTFKSIATMVDTTDKSTKNITARQQDVLTLIKRGISETGFPPTRAEISSALGLKSANSAEEHLRALERKGVIELIAGSSRGIRIKHPFHDKTPNRAVQQAKNWLGLTLPLIGRVAAGAPMLATEHIEAEYQVTPDLFSATPDYLLRVSGQSMKNIGIMDGDLLAVKSSQVALNGQIIVARVGTEVTVKRFMRHADRIELLPENDAFKPIVITDASDEFAIEGLAVGLMRVGI